MLDINNYRDISFLRLLNSNMTKYDLVINELKEKFKVRKKYELVLDELKNLQWNKTNLIEKYEIKINNIFEKNERILNMKKEKYLEKLKIIDRKLKLNNEQRDRLLTNKSNIENCPICYENSNNFGITRCGHSFCQKCLIKCISKKPQCPICRCILLNDDVLYFSDSEYNFCEFKQKSNQILQNDINYNDEYLFIPPLSNIIVRNPYNKSIIVYMKNIMNREQLNFDDFLDYDKFEKLVNNIEGNVKENYEKKLNRIIEVFVSFFRIRRGNLDSRELLSQENTENLETNV